MFGNLKKKLQQGVAQSKAVVAGFTRVDDTSEENASDSFGRPVAESTPQKDNRGCKPEMEDFYTPVFSTVQNKGLDLNALSTYHVSEGSVSSHLESVSDVSSLQGDVLSKENISRTSSISSMTSDTTFFPSNSISHSYSLQSDNKSEIGDATVNLSSASKEELCAFIKRFEQRAFKYKAKFMELAAAYKEACQERDKLRVYFQKEGKDIPEESVEDLLNKQAKTESSIISGTDKESNSSNEIESLLSRIKRQDSLLQKCRSTITSYKEKILQLSQDKHELQSKLELLPKTVDKNNSPTSDQVSRLQAQIHEARKVIKQLESDREVAIAEFKQQIHEEMEKKDTELGYLKIQNQKFLEENHSLKLEIEQLTNETEELRKTNLEQLDKARIIIKKLKDEKKLAIEQAETRIRQAELSMEEEKEKMLVDLKRGKAEAFSVMQQESEKNLSEKLVAAVEERDSFWSKKLAAQEAAHCEMLEVKRKEKEMAVAVMQEEMRHKLKEKEEDVKLALEERELQKMAALTDLDEQKDKLLLQLEELSSEKIQLSNRFSKFQEDTAYEISELENMLSQKEVEHQRYISEIQLSQEETLKKEKSALLLKSSEEIDLLKQRHAENIQSLLYKHEQELQETNTEIETYYKSQLENEKIKLKNLLTVKKGEMEKTNSNFSSPTQEVDNENSDFNSNRQKQSFDVWTDSTTIQISKTSPGTREQIQSEHQTEQDNPSVSVIQIKTLQKSNSELRFEYQNLSEELTSVKKELAVAKSELADLITKNSKFEALEQTKAQPEHKNEEGIVTTYVQELENQIKELNEEHESLKRNVDNSRIRVEELERCLEETMLEKTATESKSKEYEIQVGQLEEVIRTLESCQSTVEREKLSLEEKLTFLENIVQDLKTSKNEMIEKLHEKHETLIQQFTEEKHVLILKINEFTLQVEVLNDEINALNKALLSKNDEITSLHLVVDDNANVIKSFEAKVDKLNADFQMKSQTCSQHEVALAKSLEKFEKLKNEANAKVNGLKEIKDALTDQLNKHQKELEDLRATLIEKELLIKVSEENVIKQQEEMRNLEQTFKEQFENKQAKFKEFVKKLKDRHESEQKEKDKQLDDCFKKLALLKDLNKEKFKGNPENDNPKEEMTHNSVDGVLAKLENNLQTSSDVHNEEQKIIDSHLQQIVNLQQQLLDKEKLIQKLTSTSVSVLSESDNYTLQINDLSEKHKMEIKTLNLQLAEKDVQIQKLTVKLESLSDQSLPLDKDEELISQIQSLTQQLQEKDIKLEAMAGTISAEQESLYKQLAWQTERAEEFHAQKNALSIQLKEIKDSHNSELQTKEAFLSEVSQKALEYDKLIEILRTDNDAIDESNTSTGNLEEHLEKYKAQITSKLGNLESQLDVKNSSITVLEEEIKHLKHLKEQTSADTALNHAKQIDILKSDWDSKIAELQTVTQALKCQLKEADKKLQECIQVYEDRLAEEKLQLENQHDLLKEQINVLKQQLYESQSNANASSNMLLKGAKEDEEKLVYQLQEEIETLKQDSQQKISDLKQKYITKLKDIQNQAKKTIKELENTLQIEKLAKNEMYSELTRANTRLLQLEEHTGSSRDTIIDLEHKVGEMTVLLKSKDSELAKLKSDMSESEKNMQEIIEETLVNCKQINDKLVLAESKITDNESNLQIMNSQLQEKQAAIVEREVVIKNLENKYLDFENLCFQEKEKFICDNKEASEKCSKLECLLEKAKRELVDVQSKFDELSLKATSASLLSVELGNTEAEKLNLQTELSSVQSEKLSLQTELSNVQDEKLNLQTELSNIQNEKVNLQTELLNVQNEKLSLQTELTNIQDEKLNLQTELSNVQAEKLNLQTELTNIQDEKVNLQTELSIFQNEKLNLETELSNIQNEKLNLETELLELYVVKEELQSKLILSESAFKNVSKEHTSLVIEIENSLLERDQTGEGYETNLSHLHQAHTNEFSELDGQSNSELVDYKKKAKDYISQLRQQFHHEHTAMFEKEHQRIIELENVIATLNEEISALKHSKETLDVEHNNIIEELKAQVDLEMKLKDSVTEQCSLKEKEFEHVEQTLRNMIETLENNNDSLIKELNIKEAHSGDRNMHVVKEKESLDSGNYELSKNLESGRDEEFSLKLEDVKKSHLTFHDNKAQEQTSKTNLKKQKKLKNTGHEREVMSEQREHSVAAVSNEWHGQDREDHNNVINELRKEISDRDKSINKLHEEYHTKIKALQNEQDRKVKQLQSELASAKVNYQRKFDELDKKLKLEHYQSADCYQQQKSQGPRTTEAFEQSLTTQQTLHGNTSDYMLLQDQVILLTTHIEQMNKQHKLELAELHSRLESKQNASLPHPSATPYLNMDVLDPNFSLEMQNLELQNMDLQAQVAKLNGELSMYRIKERDSFRKKENVRSSTSNDDDDDDPPLSLDVSYMNHTDSFFREPTEFEYLKNILYEYMMGRETKTLAKVIATVVKFSDEQMKNILSKAETKTGKKS